MALTAAIIGAVVAAGAAAYGAYSTSQASAQQARYAQKAAQIQADNEAQQAEARREAVQYKTDRQMRSFNAAAASHGVQIGEGSLLETYGDFAAQANYDKRQAGYGNDISSAMDKYRASIYGRSAGYYAGQSLTSGVLTGTGSLATHVGLAGSLLTPTPGVSGGIGTSDILRG